METVRSKDGTPIAYESSGNGPPLLLVHGALGSHQRWKPIIPALAEQFTVYIMDRRGRGASGDTQPYHMEREFEDVAAVTDAIDKPVNLLGHSFGALCVLEGALHSQNVRSLIVYEPPSASIPDELIGRIQAELDAGDPEAALIMFMREVVRMPPHELERFITSPVFPSRVAVAHTLPRELNAVEHVYQFEPETFKELRVPTLLLLGGDSPPLVAQTTQHWHTALPNSRIVSMPGQQHVAMDSAPEMFIREVVAFLSDLG